MNSVPYTYLIGWSDHNTYYYGVRYAANANPSDLWVSYFTSSKYVKQFIKENGNPDIVQIRKTFSNTEKARIYEEKVLKRMNVIKDSRFLNKTFNKSIPIEFASHLSEKNGMYGKKHSEETLLKMRKPKLEKTKQKMRGRRPQFDQTGSKNNAFKGYISTPYGIFESLNDAAKSENVNFSTISYRIHSSSEKFNNYKRMV